MFSIESKLLTRWDRSCPSQLLQVGATQELNTPNNHHRLCPGSVQGQVTSSQRLKYKERPSLPVSILQRLVIALNYAI